MDKSANMKPRVLPRMLFYAITCLVHIGNLLYMEYTCNAADKLNDPFITRFSGNKHRYFTSWTVGLQIIYAGLAFCCDLVNMLELFRVPRWVLFCRNTMFAAVVWPFTLVVCSFFWSVYLYDRSLIFPVNLDHAISPVSNHIIHSFILPVVLFEVVARPRLPPMAHLTYIKHMYFHLVVYLCVLYYTYFEQGIWLYPVFKVTAGTVYFLILHLVLAALFLCFYYLQWPIGSLFHQKSRESLRAKRK